MDKTTVCASGMPVGVLAVLFLIPCYTPEKPTEDGSSAWTLLSTWATLTWLWPHPDQVAEAISEVNRQVEDTILASLSLFLSFFLSLSFPPSPFLLPSHSHYSSDFQIHKPLKEKSK